MPKCVDLSTNEVEYVASTEAYKELLRINKFLQYLGDDKEKIVLLYENQGEIHFGKNSMF